MSKLATACVNSAMDGNDLSDFDEDNKTPTTSFGQIIFNVAWTTGITKHSQHTEVMKRLTLQVISNIPSQALAIYTDGSKSDLGRTASGVFAKAEKGDFTEASDLEGPEGAIKLSSDPRGVIDPATEMRAPKMIGERDDLSFEMDPFQKLHLAVTHFCRDMPPNQSCRGRGSPHIWAILSAQERTPMEEGLSFISQ
ncbi:hypothetical protein CEXT_511031 [Caerostris extrusa]|uniref:Uncharacterized protein n=1 Tax=Caerostris extrusa TaxID=172846 RepID=A0AAV4XKL7_CAEEX|nr:hypothetical protein CEXT_511031 [Caerostris extrusa]